MRFWVDKENEMFPNKEWDGSYIFTLIRKGYSTIFTNIADIWYRMDQLTIPEIYEDLFIIGISVFALDKRIDRRKFPDCWTRNISVSIPVLGIERWKQTEELWNKTLTFLTGDIWDIHFRKCEKQFSKRENPNRKHLNLGGCNCVCLFSGGLDSNTFYYFRKTIQKIWVSCPSATSSFSTVRKGDVQSYKTIFRYIHRYILPQNSCY